MPPSYNKHLHCILHYFVEPDPEVLIRRIKPVLNDPCNINHNYVQYDPPKRALNLFARLLDLYVQDNNGEFYKCLWTVIHCAPLIMCENNPFVEEFYKSFIVNNVHCISCLMHYITVVSQFEEGIWRDGARLFEALTELHNEINESKRLVCMTPEDARKRYSEIIDCYAF